jgi:integrase
MTVFQTDCDHVSIVAHGSSTQTSQVTELAFKPNDLTTPCMWSPLALLWRLKLTKHYQDGYIRFVPRKSAPPCWEFLWRERTETDKPIRRTILIGTVEKYPTEELANAAINGLRLQLNSKKSRLSASKPLVTIGDLIDHYIHVELSPPDNWRSHATCKIYKYFLEKWIRPQWGTEPITGVRTVAIESWLRQLRGANGEILANATKAKIRNIFSVIFNHAIRSEWLEQGKNPVTLVRQSARRKTDPPVLHYGEIQALLNQLCESTRLIVMLAVTTGLRRSELFALKWCDIDFVALMISVQRSVYLGMIGNCKTETSRRPVPIEARVAADLWIWKETSKYNRADDWIFASKSKKGSNPLWPGVLLEKAIRPAAIRAGISKRIGWHTFRHTYATLLVANGENVKVVQELMRHANTRFTLEIYSQAQLVAKRAAQQRLVEAILPDAVVDTPPVVMAETA